MNKILLISLAGTCRHLPAPAGTLSRYLLSGAVYGALGRNFTWGTWSVNILGCFFFGLVWVLSDERGIIPPQGRIIILVGFMGAFSTLVFESYELLRDAEWLKLGQNMVGQNIVGLVALYLGVVCGRIL